MRAFETLGALLGLILAKLIFFLNLGLLAHWGGGGGHGSHSLGDFLLLKPLLFALRKL